MTTLKVGDMVVITGLGQESQGKKGKITAKSVKNNKGERLWAVKLYTPCNVDGVAVEYDLIPEVNLRRTI